MAFQIHNSTALDNGDWTLECFLDLPADRQRAEDVLRLINPGLVLPAAPLRVPFRLRYQIAHNALTLTIPGEQRDNV